MDDLDVDGRAILKLIVKKQRVRINLNGSRQISMTGVTGQWTFGFYKMQVIFWLAK